MVRKITLAAVLAAIAAVGAQAGMTAAPGVLDRSERGISPRVHTEAVTVQYSSTPAGSVYTFGWDDDSDHAGLDRLVGRGLDDGMFPTNEARLITGAVFPLKTLDTGGSTVDVTMAFWDTLDLPTANNPEVEPVNKNLLGAATWRITQTPGAFRAYTGSFASPILFPDQDFVVEFICTDPENGELVDWATSYTLCTGVPTIGTTTDYNGWPGWWDDDIAGPVKGVWPLGADTEGNEWINSADVFGAPVRGTSYFRLLGGTEAEIPEPGTFALLGSGLLPLLAIRRRK